MSYPQENRSRSRFVPGDMCWFLDTIATPCVCEDQEMQYHGSFTVDRRSMLVVLLSDVAGRGTTNRFEVEGALIHFVLVAGRVGWVYNDWVTN